MRKISMPEVSLPAGGGATKGMGETFHPNSFSGTAGYTVPVPLTAGRGNAPKIDLQYQSGSGNGAYGAGWDISLPFITIRTEKQIPQYNFSDVCLLAGEELVEAEGEKKVYKDEQGTTWIISAYVQRVKTDYSLIQRFTNNTGTDCYWKITGSGNTISVFGKSQNARICDPQDETHIFTWLIESAEDASGNKTVFNYKKENLENTARCDAARTAQLTAQQYIASIRYGNYFTSSGIEDFAFELVFDYGEYNLTGLDQPSADVYTPVFAWDCRPDPFSSFRSAFEIRTFRRCSNLLLFHKFENKNSNKPFLVSRTALYYDTAADYTGTLPQHEIISCLKSVVFTGYRIQENGSYESLSKPALDFTFSKFSAPEDAVFCTLQLENSLLPGYLETGQFLMVDLQREGLPGILHLQDGGALYYSPLGDGKFSAAETLPEFPAGASGVLTDLNGNGFLDLLVSIPNQAGYYENTGKDWKAFQPFEQYPVSHAHTEWADLTASGKADMLLADQSTLTRYPALGTEGYSNPEITSLPADFPLQKEGYLSELVTFADPFGDGLSHRVRISNGLFECWPSLGYGIFGDKITIANAPDFEEGMDTRRLFLADLTGTGNVDLIYAQTSCVQLFLNKSGNTFADPITITLPETFDLTDQIQFADLLGTGTSCMIFTKITGQPRHYYLNFEGSVLPDKQSVLKPYLLSAVHNNSGGSLQLHYASSVKFYLKDKQAGRPRLTTLPFPVQVVERVVQTDQVSGACFVQEYSYHDGYYDPVERIFRGFGLVETWDTQTYGSFEDTIKQGGYTAISEELFIPPVYTKKWYNTGAFLNSEEILSCYKSDYFKGDIHAYDFPDPVLSPEIYTADAETFRQAYAALGGQEIRTEVYALDGSSEAAIPYAVEQANFMIILLQEKGNQPYAVFRADPREHIAYHYERNALDPRIEQKFTLEVDSLCGQVKTAASVYLPRRPETVTGTAPYAEQLLTQVTISTHTYINTGDGAGSYWRGITCEEKQFQLHDVRSAGNGYITFNDCQEQVTKALENIIPYGKEQQPGILQAEQFSWTRDYFWDDNQQTILGCGEISFRGLAAYSESAEFTQEYSDEVYQGKLTAAVIAGKGGYVYDEISAYWWNKGTVQAYFDHTQPELFYLPNQIYNPFAAVESELSVCGTMSYDSPYHMNVVALTEYIDPSKDIKNVQYIEMDYIAFAPKQQVDVNGNLYQVLYDPLGQVTVSALYGIKNNKPQGSMPIYAGQQSIAEYIQRKTDPSGKPITLDSVIAKPDYYLQGAMSYFFYDEHAFEQTGQPVCAVSLTRNEFYYATGNDQGPYCSIKLEYTDGLGRVAEQRVQTDTRWLVSGRNVYNNKGQVTEQYLPYFSDTYIDEDAKEKQQEITAAGTIIPPAVFLYDAVGRNIRTNDPKGFFSKAVFSPWEEQLFDKNDTILDSVYYQQFMAAYPAAPTQAQKDEKDALDKASKFYHTPVINVFDNTGTQFLSITDNLGQISEDSFKQLCENSGITSGQVCQELKDKSYLDSSGWLMKKFNPYKNGFELQLNPLFAPLLTAIKEFLLQGVLTAYTQTDIQGRPLLQIDPRLYYANQSNGTDFYNFRYQYAAQGDNALMTDSIDAGKIFHFDNLFGLLIWTWTPRNYNQLVSYDRLQRKKTIRVKRLQDSDHIPALEEYPLVEEFTYGETAAQAAEYNLCGKLYTLKDLSGIVMQTSYDITGQPLAVSRQMTSVYKEAIDWNDPAKVPLDAELFHTAYTCNALGNIISELAPDQTLTRKVYNQTGQLKGIRIVLPDGVEKEVIKNIEYDANGQRMAVSYANLSRSRYTYEETTQRIINIRTTRAGISAKKEIQDTDLQHITYTYDPMGNITLTRDLSRDTVFFNNQKVEPKAGYTYDALYRLIAASGYQHPGIMANTYRNNSKDNDFKQSKFNLSPSDYSKLENYSEQYVYDDSGNLIKLVHSAKSASWTRENPVADNSNRLTAMAYDDSGNQRQIFINSPVALAYNCCENLVKAGIITRPDEADDADYYMYDSSEQRTRKVCESMANGGALTTIEHTVYCGNYQVKRQLTAGAEGNLTLTLERQTLRIMDGSTCVLMIHYWNKDSHAKEMEEGTRSYRWQLDNLQNSVGLELDDQAQLISYEEYYPFGGTCIICGPSQQEVKLKMYRYSGKERDDTTGLYYYGHRYYSAWLTRWTKPDPAGTVDGANLYAFVRGNPLALTDPDGLSTRGRGGSPASRRRARSKSPSSSVRKPSRSRSRSRDKYTKKDRMELATEMRDTITENYADKMVKKKQIHSSQLFVGKTEVIVKPAVMSAERLLVRHISTALLAQNSGFVEVQAAISHSSKTIYIASNKKQGALAELLSGVTSLKDFKIPTGSFGKREDRHIKKLKGEKNGAYADYTITHISGLEDQHAETKIIEHTKLFDYIGGTRRPCFACSLFFSINKIPASSYNPHPGGYWNAKASLLSIAPHSDSLAGMDYKGEFYKNKNVAEAHVHDYDTDSEDEG